MANLVWLYALRSPNDFVNIRSSQSIPGSAWRYAFDDTLMIRLGADAFNKSSSKSVSRKCPKKVRRYSVMSVCVKPQHHHMLNM